MPSLTDAIARLGPTLTFPWHDQQLAALRSDADVLLLLGGNRSGKSRGLAGVLGRVVRREGPIYRRLAGAATRPLKLWVAPQTAEKAESIWDPYVREVLAGMEYHDVRSPQRVFTWADSVSDRNTIWIKSQEQGFMAFESDSVDVVAFDEEPLDRRIYTSALARVTDTNGVIVLAFTPLAGMTWTHARLYEPTARPAYRLGDRHWRRGGTEVVQMGMADNPVAAPGVRRIRDDPGIGEAEKRARLYGEYGYTEGLIFPELAGIRADSDSPYLLDALPTDRPYSWVLTLDPNKRHGGLLVALDHEGNRYAVAEHYAEGLPDSQHAAAYRALVAVTGLPPEQVPTFADPGGAGAQAIINLAECGVWAQAVPKGPGSVKASIEVIRRLLWIDPARRHPVTGAQGAPRLYFLRSLRSTWRDTGVDYAESRLLWELRQYRQDEGKPPDTPVKEKDDVVDPLRYACLVRPLEADKAVWEADAERAAVAATRRTLDPLSRRASIEVDEIVTQARRGRRGEDDSR